MAEVEVLPGASYIRALIPSCSLPKGPINHHTGAGFQLRNLGRGEGTHSAYGPLEETTYLEEVRDTASRPVYVYGAGKRVRFFKTKNGILKGPSLAIFGGAKGKSI